MEGNQQKMREALLEARRFVWTSAHRKDRDLLVTDDEKRGPYVLSPKDTLAKIDAALSAPPRNCDVGTAEEQETRFNDYCRKHYDLTFDLDSDPCKACPFFAMPTGCRFAWAQMPYEEEEGGAK